MNEGMKKSEHVMSYQWDCVHNRRIDRLIQALYKDRIYALTFIWVYFSSFYSGENMGVDLSCYIVIYEY